MTEPSETANAGRPVSDSDKDRIAGWKIAVFSGLLGLVGAVVGGFFSYLVAVHSSDSQAQQDRADYVRQQSQTAYTKMISDATDVLLGPNQCVPVPANPSKSQSTALSQQLTSTLAEVKLLEEDESGVEIVGSNAAATDAGILQANLAIVEADCPLLAADNAKATSDVQKATTAAIKARQDLVNDARIDLLQN